MSLYICRRIGATPTLYSRSTGLLRALSKSAAHYRCISVTTSVNARNRINAPQNIRTIPTKFPPVAGGNKYGISFTQRANIKISTTSQRPAPETQEPQPPSSKPAYKPPTTGLIARTLPTALLPFAELSRLSAPAGTIYLLTPCILSLLMSASLVTPLATPTTVLQTAGLFAIGATIMRGAGCTINDLWDRNLDKHVERTRLRPLARGAVSVPAAITWFGAQCLAGLAVLWHFPPGAIALAVPSLLLVTTYPLAKRVTGYPQFVLGLTFSWGALLGLPALGVDVNSLVPALEYLVALVSGFGIGSATQLGPELLVSPAAAVGSSVLLYSSCVLWTLLYDTIYAFQDIRDDRLIGIRSSALSFSSLTARRFSPKAPLAALAVAQISVLALLGYTAGFGPAYYLGTCGVGGTVLAGMIRGVRLGDVQSCRIWFARGAWLGLGGLSLGFLAEWIWRLMESEDQDQMNDRLIAQAGDKR